MASIPEAISQLKTAFLAMTPPTGYSLGGRVWAWPADRALVNRETFPFIICAQVLNEPGTWRQVAGGMYSHTWPAEALICLAPFTSRDDISAENEAATAAWLLAGARVLFDPEGLTGGTLKLGPSARQFTSRMGNMGWLTEAELWGVYYRIPVTQTVGLTDDEECD
jgi:hypothetical protein